MFVTLPPVSQESTPAEGRLLNPAANHQKLYQIALVVMDIVMLVGAFSLAYWLRFFAGITVAPEVIPFAERYIGLVSILLPSWLILFTLMHMYDMGLLLNGTREYSRALNACTSGMMLVVLLSFVEERFIISRGWLVMSWIFSGVFVCTGRVFLRHLAIHLRQKGYFVSRAIIIGTNEEALTLASQLKDPAVSGLEVQGFIETDTTCGSLPFGKPPILGDLYNLHEIIRQQNINEVIVSSTALDRSQLLSLLRELSLVPQVELRLSSGLYEAVTTNMHVAMKGTVPFMSPDRWRLNSMELTLKRLLDISVILIAVPVLLPLFAIFALLIKLDSPGPVFYYRKVLGVGGRTFGALKFRTMAVDGDQILEQYPELKAQLLQNHKLKDDPRITRVGRWLRLTSLDELPQLINILLGQMSLVGPRMISPVEAEMYGIYSADLLTVKPGLTGLWQVSGRSDLTYGERIHMDMYYVRNYSILMDLQILFLRTLPAVIKGQGAY